MVWTDMQMQPLQEKLHDEKTLTKHHFPNSSEKRTY